MKIKNLILSLTMLFALVGCFKDNGNYDYVKSPEISFRLASKPSIILGGKILYKPEIKLPEGYTTEFTYEWTVDNSPVVSTADSYEFVGKEIGYFEVRVTATDVKTGMKYTYSTNARVTTLFESGFLILTEDGENTDMHFIRTSEIRADKNTGSNDSLAFKDEYMNIYKNLIGQKIAGKPVKMREHWVYEGLLGEITVETNVAGKHKFIELNGTTMKPETSIEEEFTNNDIPSNFAPKDIIHSYWDSYILNGDGCIYPRRSGVSTDYHTGRFDKRLKLWGKSIFTDIFCSYYPDGSMFLAVEKDPITNKRSFVGIYESTHDSDPDQSSTKIIQNPGIEEYMDFKGEILFHDYFRGTRVGGDRIGSDAFIVKDESNRNFLHILTYKNQEPDFRFTKTVKIDLSEKGVSVVKGMFTFKTTKDRIVYLYDDRNIYYYDQSTDAFGTVHTYSKTIAAVCCQSFVSRNGIPEDDVKFKEIHIAVGFTDGSLEIQQLECLKSYSFFKKVFETKENYGVIKQIIYKLGPSGAFQF